MLKPSSVTLLENRRVQIFIYYIQASVEEKLFNYCFSLKAIISLIAATTNIGYSSHQIHKQDTSHFILTIDQCKLGEAHLNKADNFGDHFLNLHKQYTQHFVFCWAGIRSFHGKNGKVANCCGISSSALSNPSPDIKASTCSRDKLVW